MAAPAGAAAGELLTFAEQRLMNTTPRVNEPAETPRARSVPATRSTKAYTDTMATDLYDLRSLLTDQGNFEAASQRTLEYVTMPSRLFLAARGAANGSSVRECFSQLEGAASKHPSLAIILMVALYDVASDQCDHDTCDEISLWVATRATSAVRKFLDACAAWPDCPIGEKVEEWNANFRRQPRFR